MDLAVAEAGWMKWMRLGLSHRVVFCRGVVDVAVSGPFPVAVAVCLADAHERVRRQNFSALGSLLKSCGSRELGEIAG